MSPDPRPMRGIYGVETDGSMLVGSRNGDSIRSLGPGGDHPGGDPAPATALAAMAAHTTSPFR